MKRLLSLFLAVPMLIVSMLNPAAAENVGSSIVIGMVSSSTYVIRPLIPGERSMVSLFSLVYESLVYEDDSGMIQPLLAEDWSVSNSGKTITFTLRKDIRFSDGTPITAQDVAASGTYLLELANNENVTDHGFYQNMKYSIDKFETSGTDTVIVTCKRGYYGSLCNCIFPVVKANEIDVDNPVGSGPYVISAFLTGDMMLLDANTNWWQIQPQVKQISVSFFSNNKDLMTAYEYGRVDTIFTRSVSAAQYKSGNSSISMSYSTRQLEMLLLSHDNHAYPLNDPAVRKAIRYAINVDYILQKVYMNMGKRTYTTVPTDSWLYLDNESAFVYNPDKARAILAEAGWADMDGNGVLDHANDNGIKHLVLGLHVYEDPENNLRFEAANTIADMLAEIGISVHVETCSYTEAQNLLSTKQFDMFLCAIQMDVNPDPGFMLYKSNPMNYMNYSSSEMNSLIKTMRESDGINAFFTNMQRMQQQFEIDTPFISLFYRTGTVLTRKMYTTVRNIRENELLRGIEAFNLQ